MRSSSGPETRGEAEEAYELDEMGDAAVIVDEELTESAPLLESQPDEAEQNTPCDPYQCVKKCYTPDYGYPLAGIAVIILIMVIIVFNHAVKG